MRSLFLRFYDAFHWFQWYSPELRSVKTSSTLSKLSNFFALTNFVPPQYYTFVKSYALLLVPAVCIAAISSASIVYQMIPIPVKAAWQKVYERKGYFFGGALLATSFLLGEDLCKRAGALVNSNHNNGANVAAVAAIGTTPSIFSFIAHQPRTLTVAWIVFSLSALGLTRLYLTWNKGAGEAFQHRTRAVAGATTCLAGGALLSTYLYCLSSVIKYYSSCEAIAGHINTNCKLEALVKSDHVDWFFHLAQKRMGFRTLQALATISTSITVEGACMLNGASFFVPVGHVLWAVGKAMRQAAVAVHVALVRPMLNALNVVGSHIWSGVRVLATKSMQCVRYGAGTIADVILLIWRNIVLPAYKGVKYSVEWAIQHIISPLLTGFKSFATYAFCAIKRVLVLLVNAGTWCVAQIVAAAKWSGRNVLVPVYDVIVATLHVLWDTFVWCATKVCDGLKWCWRNIVVPLFNVLQRVAQQLYHGIMWVAQKIIEGVQWCWYSVVVPIVLFVSEGVASIARCIYRLADNFWTHVISHVLRGIYITLSGAADYLCDAYYFVLQRIRRKSTNIFTVIKREVTRATLVVWRFALVPTAQAIGRGMRLGIHILSQYVIAPTKLLLGRMLRFVHNYWLLSMLLVSAVLFWKRALESVSGIGEGAAAVDVAAATKLSISSICGLILGGWTHAVIGSMVFAAAIPHEATRTFVFKTSCEAYRLLDFGAFRVVRSMLSVARVGVLTILDGVYIAFNGIKRIFFAALSILDIVAQGTVRVLWGVAVQITSAAQVVWRKFTSIFWLVWQSPYFSFAASVCCISGAFIFHKNHELLQRIALRNIEVVSEYVSIAASYMMPVLTWISGQFSQNGLWLWTKLSISSGSLTHLFTSSAQAVQRGVVSVSGSWVSIAVKAGSNFFDLCKESAFGWSVYILHLCVSRLCHSPISYPTATQEECDATVLPLARGATKGLCLPLLVLSAGSSHAFTWCLSVVKSAIVYIGTLLGLSLLGLVTGGAAHIASLWLLIGLAYPILVILYIGFVVFEGLRRASIPTAAQWRARHRPPQPHRQARNDNDNNNRIGRQLTHIEYLRTVIPEQPWPSDSCAICLEACPMRTNSDIAEAAAASVPIPVKDGVGVGVGGFVANELSNYPSENNNNDNNNKTDRMIDVDKSPEEKENGEELVNVKVDSDLSLPPSPAEPLPPSVYLPCGHLFHEECIGEWIAAHRLCPTCRTPLLLPAAAAAGANAALRLVLL